MHTQKIAYIITSIFLGMLLSISSLNAQNIKPIGEAISKDKVGNIIYQTPANGIKIAYKLVGSGEPLVLIMGLGGTMNQWPQKAIDLLSKKYQLIISDNRGMGNTTVNKTKFTYKLFADDIIALMDKLQIKRANLLGFSMGSTISQKLLFDYPQRFKKAIIYATSTDGSEVSKALNGKVPKNPIVKRQVEATIAWKTPMDKLPLIKNQIMFMVGTNDTIVGTKNTIKMAGIIPGAWLVQFKNAKHTLMIQAPVRFAKTILLFLDIDETVRKK